MVKYYNIPYLYGYRCKNYYNNFWMLGSPKITCRLTCTDGIWKSPVKSVAFSIIMSNLHMIFVQGHALLFKFSQNDGKLIKRQRRCSVTEHSDLLLSCTILWNAVEQRGRTYNLQAQSLTRVVCAR